ncbi:flagellar hook basal-body protein [bacterium]|nr:flagellar hook basal-body protein [bacterium]
MMLKGGIDYFEPGMRSTLRAMHLQMEIVGIHAENINGFDKVGYQRKDPVVSSFSEYVGFHALSTAIDDQPGRISISENPLDLALSNKGFFQVLGKEGIKLTRDGRFHYDKDGNLLTLENEKVMSNDGTPIVLPCIPETPNDIVIDLSGNIKVVDRENNKVVKVGTLSVVSTNGAAVLDPGVRQGFTENSNVIMSEEAMKVYPVQKNFSANRQMFQQCFNLVSTAVSRLSQM